MTGKGLLLEMANHIADIFTETLVMETGTNRRRTIAAIIFHFLRVGQINRGDIILPQMSDIQVPNLYLRPVLVSLILIPISETLQ